jgi:hypothetical protein
LFFEFDEVVDYLAHAVVHIVVLVVLVAHIISLHSEDEDILPEYVALSVHDIPEVLLASDLVHRNLHTGFIWEAEVLDDVSALAFLLVRMHVQHFALAVDLVRRLVLVLQLDVGQVVLLVQTDHEEVFDEILVLAEVRLVDKLLLFVANGFKFKIALNPAAAIVFFDAHDRFLEHAFSILALIYGDLDVEVADVALAGCLDDLASLAVHLLHSDSVLGVVVDLLGAGVPDFLVIEVRAHVFRKQGVRSVVLAGPHDSRRAAKLAQRILDAVVLADLDSFFAIAHEAWLVLLMSKHLELVHLVNVEVTLAVSVGVIAVLQICILWFDGILNDHKIMVEQIMATGVEQVNFVLVLDFVAHRHIPSVVGFVLFLPNYRVKVARILNQLRRLLAKQGFLGRVSATESFASRIYRTAIGWEFAFVD